jgi:cob(I)alamin adenosyltransferase
VRRIIVITGNGKGKTTSAIGCAVRAAGRGLKVGFYQFLKSKDAEYGEHIFFKAGKKLKLVPLGLGCKKDFKYNDKDIQAAQDGFKKIIGELGKKKYDMLVMDEISYPVNWGWIKLDDVIGVITGNSRVNFVLTGRDMPQGLLDIADTASNVQEVKHAYTKAVPAQLGIEC